MNIKLVQSGGFGLQQLTLCMSSKQNQKSKFRSTSVWKKFRSRLKSERKVDYITQKKLLSGWNLHHCDLDESHYTDLSNEENYVCLNKMMHSVVHDLYRYYVKDETVIDRLLEILQRMKEINEK